MTESTDAAYDARVGGRSFEFLQQQHC
jgi:hypothetical protein